MTHLRIVTPSADPTFSRYTFGDTVAVLSRGGIRDTTGRIVGVHRCNPAQYDVQPDEGGTRMFGIPEGRLVSLERVL